MVSPVGSPEPTLSIVDGVAAVMRLARVARVARAADRSWLATIRKEGVRATDAKSRLCLIMWTKPGGNRKKRHSQMKNNGFCRMFLVEPAGLEPATS